MDPVRDKHDFGQSLPWEIAINARDPKTMDTYGKNFRNWLLWLHRNQRTRSPQSLIDYFFSLDGTPQAKQALSISSGIIHCLKLVDDAKIFLESSFLRLIIEGVYRSAPKLLRPPRKPLRWSHVVDHTLRAKRDRLFIRDTVMMIVGLFGMMRASELVSLQRDNITGCLMGLSSSLSCDVSRGWAHVDQSL